MVKEDVAALESWITSCSTIEQLDHMIHIVYNRVDKSCTKNLIELIERKKQKKSRRWKKDIN